ncbi:MAG: hypothetical protein ACK4L4_04430 [Gemmobacter sp.]
MVGSGMAPAVQGPKDRAAGEESPGDLRSVSGRVVGASVTRSGRPPLLVIASPVLPTHLLALVRHAVPVVLPYGAVTGLVLARLNPPAVAMALMCPRHDAARMARLLERLDYPGRMVLLAPPLPDRAMVLAELRAQVPGLRLSLMMLPDLSRPAAAPR